jgi:hypothetical protein
VDNSGHGFLLVNVILILLLVDLVWELGLKDASLAIQPTVHAIRLTLDMAAVYSSHCLLVLEIAMKYNLKAVITFYGEHYVACVNTNGWMHYDDRQAHHLQKWKAMKENMINGH